MKRNMGTKKKPRFPEAFAGASARSHRRPDSLQDGALGTGRVIVVVHMTCQPPLPMAAVDHDRSGSSS
jgi:hypothetical protein